ncbi:MAG: helix-turn-helix domain-containing protein [Atopobiaceae bacterium]|nr:helix-turn-helix domain-containing protein [Atopobiaceae bacterium]
MEITKIVDQLEGFGIHQMRGCDTPTYIQTHKMLPPGEERLFPACLYVGYASQLPSAFVGDERLSVICIEDCGVPRGVLERSELNLYLLPPDIDQFDVLNKIADILIDEAWVTAAMRRILDDLYSGAGIQALTDTASDIFGNPVFVNDSSFKMLAMTQGVTFENDQLEEQKELGYVHPDIVEAMRRDDIDFELGGHSKKTIVVHRPDSEEVWLFSGISLHGIVMGFIGIPNLFREHAPRDIELLERFSKIVAVEMEKDDFYRDSRGVKFGYLLSDLLSGKVQSRRTIEQRAKSVRWELKPWTRIVTVVDPAGFIPAERVQSIAQRVQHIIHGARWTTFKHNIVFFVCRDTRGSLTENEVEGLADFLGASSLAAGMSMPFSDLLEATKYHRQSLRAVDAGLLVRRAGPIFDYSEMLTYYAAQTLLKRNDADEFCPESISIVKEYDVAHETELCRTLEQYLLHVGDPVAAAEALHVHRNTLLYRINKVRELTGMDLTDGNERLAAQLYFRLDECRRSVLQMERG